MNQPAFRFERIRVRELPAFADDVISQSQPGQFVPITRQRAIAHAQNPNADDEDVGLLVAFDSENEIVGYFGILPVMLRIGENLSKTHWFTTWSVSSKVRGMGVGTKLMEEALNLNRDFLIVGSIHARRVCEKFGFLEHEPLEYRWIDLSGMGVLNPLTWILRLSRKIGFLLKLDKDVPIANPATRWIHNRLSPFTKKIFYPFLHRKLLGYLGNIQVKEVTEIRPDELPFANRPDTELYRSVEVINWMLTYPWVLETGQSDTEDRDYFFSDTRPHFEFIATEVYTKDQVYQGFAVFSISKKNDFSVLKTLDYQIKSNELYSEILALAVHYGRKYQADIIEIPKEFSLALQNTVLGKVLLQKRTRIYQCHPKSMDSPLANAWSDIQFHLYDGDMAFS